MFDLGPAPTASTCPYPPTPVVRESDPATARARGRARAAPRYEPPALPADAVRRGDDARRCSPRATTRRSGSRGEEPGGTFDVSTTATTDPDVAAEELSGDEFVFDVQTHLLDFDLSDGDRGQRVRAAASRTRTAARTTGATCFGVDHWLEELFVRSDTTMAVISAVPILATPNPLSIEVMEAARRGRGAGVRRRRPRVPARAGEPERRRRRRPRSTACAGSRPSTRSARGRCTRTCPTSGAGGSTTTTPTRCSAAGVPRRRARDRPARSCACTRASAAAASTRRRSTSGPRPRPTPTSRSSCTTPATTARTKVRTPQTTADAGINRLLASLDDAGIEPGGERVRRARLDVVERDARPDAGRARARQAAGALRRRPRAAGVPTRSGTASPQDQIQAFRTFQISAEFQEQYGYPELTDAIEAQGVRAERGRSSTASNP